MKQRKQPYHDPYFGRFGRVIEAIGIILILTALLTFGPLLFWGILWGILRR